jgi:DNA (cytosine-5)-methyltransferase 1
MVGPEEAFAGHLLASTGSVAHCLNAGGMGRQDYETETMIAHALRGEGFDASEDGTGRGTPLVPVASKLKAKPGDPSHPLAAGAHAPAIAFTQNQSGDVLTGEVMHSLQTNSNATGRSSPNVLTEWAVRRLTPRECERLQGFPDDFTSVPYRKKPAADGPRYKALGNSMAVNVMRVIGERIALVDALEAA